MQVWPLIKIKNGRSGGTGSATLLVPACAHAVLVYFSLLRVSRMLDATETAGVLDASVTPIVVWPPVGAVAELNEILKTYGREPIQYVITSTDLTTFEPSCCHTASPPRTLRRWHR